MCLNKRRVDCCKVCSYLGRLSYFREMCDDFMMEGKISEGQYLKEMNELKEKWDMCSKLHKTDGCTDHHSDINDGDEYHYDDDDRPDMQRRQREHRQRTERLPRDDDEEIEVTEFEWRGIFYIRDDAGNLYDYESEIVGTALNGLVTIF